MQTLPSAVLQYRPKQPVRKHSVVCIATTGRAWFCKPNGRGVVPRRSGQVYPLRFSIEDELVQCEKAGQTGNDPSIHVQLPACLLVCVSSLFCVCCHQ